MNDKAAVELGGLAVTNDQWTTTKRKPVTSRAGLGTAVTWLTAGIADVMGQS